MDETLFCPFTRQPCMGRMCACAMREVRGSIAYGLRWHYYCGLARGGGADGAEAVDVEEMDDESAASIRELGATNDYRRD